VEPSFALPFGARVAVQCPTTLLKFSRESHFSFFLSPNSSRSPFT
jgi:hypothetical protein